MIDSSETNFESELVFLLLNELWRVKFEAINPKAVTKNIYCKDGVIKSPICHRGIGELKNPKYFMIEMFHN